MYLAYLKVPLVDQDKIWAPHKVCAPCVDTLRKWFRGEPKCLKIRDSTDMERTERPPK